MAKKWLVHSAQLLFADPTRTLEVAVWEEGLKSMLLCWKDPSGELDEEGQLQKVLAGLLTEKLCLRVDFGINKAGSGMYHDLFDISPQVIEEGQKREQLVLSKPWTLMFSLFSWHCVCLLSPFSVTKKLLATSSVQIESRATCRRNATSPR